MSVRARLVLLGFVVVLCLSECYQKSSKARSFDESDASNKGKTEAGPDEDGAIRAGDFGFDASSAPISDAEIDTSTNARCRVVDSDYNITDDAAVMEVDLTGLIVSGVISHDGECLSNVEVCLIYRDGDRVEVISAITDRYGVFELSTRVENDPLQFLFATEVELIPRKAGYTFEPSSHPLSVSVFESSVDGLSITAVKEELPSYAIGDWRVVEETCGASSGLRLTPTVDCHSFGFLPNELDNVLTFKDGCLFGGISCVEGLHYQDEKAFCRVTGPDFQGISRTLFSEGDFDEESQQWRIIRTYHQTIPLVGGPGNMYTFTKRMVLERES